MLADYPTLRLRDRCPRDDTEGLQPHQVDQKLAPQVNHAAPGVFNISGRGLFKNAFMNVVCDLSRQSFLLLGSICPSSEASISTGTNFVPPRNPAWPW